MGFAHVMTRPAEPREDLFSIGDLVTVRLPRHGTRTAIRYDNGANYSSVGFDEYVRNAHRMIAWLATRGAGQQIVATLTKNRPEWDMTALAALHTGNIVFPLDTTMNDAELTHLLRQSPPDFILISRAQRERIRRILAGIGIRPRVLVANLYDVYEDQGLSTPTDLDENEILMSSIPVATEGAVPPPSPLLRDGGTVLGHYATSGTTSLPKIVQITHGNIVAQMKEAMSVVNLRRNEDLLNIGPYTHIATLLEFLVTRSKGFAVTYFTREIDEDGVLEREIKKLKKQRVRIKALMAVPKFWVFIMKEVLEEMKNKPVLRNLYLHLVSIEKNAGLHDIGTVDKAKLVAMRRIFKTKMGGYFSYGISSSTRLDPGVVDIFAKLGVTVIDIYGATEASGIIARNKLNESRRGSCGRLLEDLEVKLEDVREIPGIDFPVGELLIKGPTVSKGYLGRDPRDHLDGDGYYRTGDLAFVDEDRYVHLVGRQQELIRWDDDTFIDPMHVSNLLVRSIWIKDALVAHLDGDDFLSVFVYPDSKRIEKDAQYRERIRTGMTPDQALRPMLEEAIAHAQSLARITPRLASEKIYLLQKKLARTPTHKIKTSEELTRLDLSRFL